MRVGLFGGTFDPVHIGHLITSMFVKERRALDKIILIPNHQSPLKPDYNAASSSDRNKMLELATDGQAGIEISDYEITNQKTSYTVNTLEFFLQKYRNIELIIGYDNFLCFDQWYEYKNILQMCKVVVMRRSDSSNLHPDEFISSKVCFVDTPLIEISATNIRERIKNKLPIKYLVPEQVENYIITNKLYL